MFEIENGIDSRFNYPDSTRRPDRSTGKVRNHWSITYIKPDLIHRKTVQDTLDISFRSSSRKIVYSLYSLTGISRQVRSQMNRIASFFYRKVKVLKSKSMIYLTDAFQVIQEDKRGV